MATIFNEKDCDLSIIKDKTIGIIGYGSQGRSQALNLRDSGLNVIISLNDPVFRKKAEGEGFTVLTNAELVKKADVIVFLAPDAFQAQIYQDDIASNLSAGKLLMFAHGFNIHYGQIVPPADVDIAMIAPKGPGQMVREVYVQGNGVPALVAVYQDATGKAEQIALAYAKGIGSARAGVLETTFAEETETDLFGEQAVLCGGATALIKAGFETLVEAGYQPEVAYFECLHELKLIVDLIYKGGIAYMRNSISDTAKYGDYTRGPRVVSDEVYDEMAEILTEIQDGRFAREWILENQAGRPVYNALKKMESEHLIEEVGEELRGMMSWLKDSK